MRAYLKYIPAFFLGFVLVDLVTGEGLSRASVLRAALSAVLAVLILAYWARRAQRGGVAEGGGRAPEGGSSARQGDVFSRTKALDSTAHIDGGTRQMTKSGVRWPGGDQGSRRRAAHERSLSRRRAGWLVMAVLVVGHPMRLAAQDSLRISRLVTLGKLWYAARLFHPYLAYRHIDWDSALAVSVPKVSTSGSTAAYAAAVQEMLTALSDPLTRVEPIGDAHSRGAPSRGEPHPLARWIADSTLVVTATNYADLVDGDAAVARFSQIATLVTRARAVVLDLRRVVPSPDGDLSSALTRSGLLHHLVTDTLMGPGRRSRMHSGYAPEAVFSASFYSAWQTRDGNTLVPGPGASNTPVVFVVNEDADLPEAIVTLVGARRAALLAVGATSDAPFVDIARFPLGEGRFAHLRLSELVFPDGGAGIPVDAVLPADAGDSAIIHTALGLLRRMPLPSRTRGTLRPTAAPVVRAYPEWAFPPLGYRLLAAYRVWGAMEYFHAYRQFYDENWDAVLGRLLPKFELARDSLEYALALAELVAHIDDSHGAVRSAALRAYFGTAAPPIVARLVEGSPVVTYITHDSIARAAGIAIGDVILQVDGEDAAARMARYARYQAASTPQSRGFKAVSNFLLGPEGSTAALAVRDREDRVQVVRLPRRASFRPACYGCRSGEMLHWVGDSIGYVDLDRLPESLVDSMFAMFRHARGIIFDMRGYPQGTAWSIAPRLTDRKQVMAARFRRRQAVAPRAAVGFDGTAALDATLDFEQYLPPTTASRYHGPTVMLIDERTISQAEHTGLFFRAANGTVFVGSPTAGADGDVTTVVVPGGIIVRFTGHEVRHPDGRALHRVGLVPDVEVKPTIAGIRAGRDEVLERAIGYLREHRSRP